MTCHRPIPVFYPVTIHYLNLDTDVDEETSHMVSESCQLYRLYQHAEDAIEVRIPMDAFLAWHGRFIQEAAIVPVRAIDIEDKWLEVVLIDHPVYDHSTHEGALRSWAPYIRMRLAHG